MPAVNVSGRIALPIDRAILAVLFIAAAIFYNSLQIHHDVAWYVYCNLQQLKGARLYVDFIEINPPIAFYLTMPPVAFASATGLPINTCIVVFVLAITAGSLQLALAMDRDATPMEKRWKTVAGAVILIVIPISVFAQREHFAVLLSLPYFFLCGARLRRQKVTPWMAIAAGLMAGLGLSIKPYFLLASFVVEAYVVVASGNLKALFRTEIYAAIAAGLLHATFAIVVHPEYFTVAVPLILSAYDAYTSPLWWIALQAWNTAVLAGMVFWVLARRRVSGAVGADALFAAACGFALCVIWQQKGWAYQTLPASVMVAFASLELSALALSGRAQVVGLAGRQKWTIPAAPIGLILLQAVISGPYRNALAVDAAQYVERYAAGGSIFVMTSNMSTGFPLAIDANVTWASRFATQWLLPMVIRDQQSLEAMSDPERERLARLAQYDLDAIVADFEKFKPDLVFVDHFYEDNASRLYLGMSFNLLEYYRRDPRFSKLWSDYKMVDTLPARVPDYDRTLDIWVRQTAINP